MSRRRSVAEEPHEMLLRGVVVAAVLGAAWAGGEDLEFGTGARLLMKIYEDCHRKSFVPCLKVKAINFFERAARAREISLADGVTIVRDAPAFKGPLTEADVESDLPRSAEEARDARLNAILFNRIADFFNSHRVVMSLPKIDPSEIRQGVEEGRSNLWSPSPEDIRE